MFKLSKHSKVLIAVIGIIVLSLYFAACGKKGPDQKTDNKNEVNNVAAMDTAGATTGDWLIIREMADPEKLNPIVSNDASASEIDSYIYEQLADQDPVTYEMTTRLAEKPEISADFLTYTYKLKKGVAFSDGQPVDR